MEYDILDEVEHVIDNSETCDYLEKYEKLKKALNDILPNSDTIDLDEIKNIVNIGENRNEDAEYYGLNFVGRSYAQKIKNLPIRTVLNDEVYDHDDKSKIIHNEKPENKDSENLYIIGDNLEALKHLRNSYREKIKCIYIDPPYNTGKEFTYSDKFGFKTIEDIKKFLGEGISDKEAQRINNVVNKDSHSHSAWLTFMYPRLKLAKDLLTTDGVIFISIDDHEQANLKLLCDSIFGEENFVVSFIWEKHKAPKNDNKYVTENHEYVLLYAKIKENFFIVKDERTEENIESFSNLDNDPRGPWTSGPLLAPTYSASAVFPIIKPNGDKIYPPKGKCWAFSEKSIKELFNDNRIWCGKDGKNVPRIKRFLSELPDGIVPRSILFHDNVGGNQKASNELKTLFDNRKIFDYSKPVSLIKYLISKVILNEDSIILDFFSGSATTAHACMELNAEDGGNRKFIMVQLPEECNEKSAAYNAGYKTIDEIGRERIKRAAEKIKNEWEERNKTQGLEFEEFKATMPDLGFKAFKLIDSIKDLEERKEITETLNLGNKDPKNLLYTWMCYDGKELVKNPEKIDLENYTAYKVDDRLYLLDKDFNENNFKILTQMIINEELHVSYIVLNADVFNENNFSMFKTLKIKVFKGEIKRRY